MKAIITSTMGKCPGFLVFLLFIVLTLSPCVHLSFGAPSFPTIPKLDGFPKKPLPSQQILAITSLPSSNGIEFPSQSKSTTDELPLSPLSYSESKSPPTFPPSSPSNKYKFIYAKKLKNFLYNRKTTTNPNPTEIGVVHIHQLSLTRQIVNSSENRVSLHFLEKVTTSKGEEVNLNLNQSHKERVTDVNPQFEFQAGLSSSTLSEVGLQPQLPLPSQNFVHLPEVNDTQTVVNSNHDDTQTQTDANSDTNPVTLLLKGNGNGNSSSGFNNSGKKAGESFVIKKVLDLHLPNNKTVKERESRRIDTQFPSKDNNTNKTVDATNLEDSHVFLFSSSTKGPEWNVNSGIGVPLLSKTRSSENDNVDTSIDATDHDRDDIENRISLDKKSQAGVDFDSATELLGDLYFTTEDHVPSCYRPVLVNQKTFLDENSADAPKLFFPKDMNKWEKNLVKISQCVATCLEGSLSSYNMSQGKGINEGGGDGRTSSSKKQISGKNSFPMGISTLALNLGEGNYNGAINRVHSRDKMLSSCQQSCNFLPEKSSENTIYIKTYPAPIPQEGKTTPTDNSIGDVSNQNREEVPEEAGKNDKNSSIGDAKNKTTSKSNTKFHLHWPSVISSIKNKVSPVIYNVMVLSPNPYQDEDKHPPHLLHPTWKLIDQTVAQRTEISLPSWSSLSCGEKLKSFPEIIQPQETLITQSSEDDKSHHHSMLQSKTDPISLKVMAIGVNGVEKVFSGLLILVSSSDDKSESACCQSFVESEKSGAISGKHSTTYKKNTEEPLRNLGHHHPEENTNSANVSPNLTTFSGSNSGTTQENSATARSSNLVILKRNKNSNIASNEINFKRSWALNGMRLKTTYSETNLTTRGKIDTDNTNEVKGNENEKGVNRDDLKERWVEFESKSRVNNDWGLRTGGMVYQNFLVVTEIVWKVPDVLVTESNQVVVEKEPSGHFFSGDKNINGHDTDTTKGESHLVSLPESGGNKKTRRGYQFLLTWEISGGGLKGNLVTDMTSASISLWPDTAYFIQVGLIDTDSESVPSSEGTFPSSSEEQEKHQNYMSNLLGMESIIFPLAPEPRVTFTSARLLLNTSSVIMSAQNPKKVSITKKSSPSMSLSGQVVITPRRNDRTRPKSNNPLLSPEASTFTRERNLQPQLWDKNKVKLDKEVEATENVRPITISRGGEAVSRNGNEFRNGHLFPYQKNIRKDKNSGHSVVSSNKVEDHPSQRNHLFKLDTASFDKHNKKYYENYNGGDADKSSSYSESHYVDHDKGMMGDSPARGKFSGRKLPKPALLIQESNQELTEENEKIHGKLYHQHSQSRHYLDTSSSSSGSSRLTNSTTTHYKKDRTPNINDNKSNNNPKMETLPGKGSDHHKQHREKEATASAYRPEGHQGLFALNLGLGGYNYNYDHDEQEMNLEKFSDNRTIGVGDTGASVVYSVFVLIVVGCVIFLFLVAFIGFFVVTSSISTTAEFFIPKRLRVWVIGGESEGELLAGNEEEEHYYDQGEGGGGRGFGEDGRFMGDDLDDDLAVGEWGDDIREEREEDGQQYSLSESASSRRGRGQSEVNVDMTDCDIGRS